MDHQIDRRHMAGDGKPAAKVGFCLFQHGIALRLGDRQMRDDLVELPAERRGLTARQLLARTAVAFRDDIVVQAGARLQIERPHIDAELPTPYVDWIELLASLLVAARESGELRAGVSPEAAARFLVSAFFGAQHISDVLQGRADVVERWAETSELLFYAIRAR